MPLWFRELARRCRSGPPATPPPGRRARTRSVLLRLEPVEDRTLASGSLPEAVDPLPGSDSEAVTRPSELPVPDDILVPDDSPDRIPVNDLAPGDSFGPGTGDPSTPATTVDQRLVEPLVQPGRQSPATPDLAAPADGAPRSDTPPGTPGTDAAPPPAESERDTPARPTTTPAGGRAADATPPAAPTPDAGAQGQTTPAAPGSRSAANGSPTARPGPEPAGPMPNGRAAEAAGPTAAASVGRPTGELPDGALLQRFVGHKDQGAFAALVQRHERFVLAVCQRVLGDPHAAQDALQATFLVLARKAGMLDRQTPLGGWLYKVAYHVALRLRGVSARQRRTEAEAAAERAAERAADGPAEVERQEIREAVREELQRLPEKYRTPLEMCYIDGRTHAEAAREIGLPRGSMAKRVGEGLDRLRERLEVRGVTL
jgi:RNA polymerase sigma factor (sigma-70 family)